MRLENRKKGVFYCCLLLFFLCGGFVKVWGAEQGNEEEYKEQVSFIKDEIRLVQDDLDWLVSKVNDMEDFGRTVPKRMTDSIAFKKSKIDALKKVLARYEKQLSKKVSKPEPQAIAVSNVVRSVPPKIRMVDENLVGLKNRLSQLKLDDWLEVEALPQGGVCLKSRLPILFQSGSAKVPSGYQNFFRKVAELVKKSSVSIVVDGYADTDPIRTSSYPSNFELGAARAGAVVRALVEYGVHPSVFKIGSTGEYIAKTPSSGVGEWKNLQRHVNFSIFIQSADISM